MFSPNEQRNIELKAIEQAMQAAGIANVDPDALLPILDGGWIATWTSPTEIIGEHCFSYACGLTEWDRAFLRSCPLPISPA